MSNQLLEQYVRIQVAINECAAALRERIREQRGQTTVEWLVIMVALIALLGALTTAGVWTAAAQAIAGAVKHIVDTVSGKAV